MQYLNYIRIAVVLIGAIWGGGNFFKVSAATKPQGESFTADYAKYAGGPVAVSLAVFGASFVPLGKLKLPSDPKPLPGPEPIVNVYSQSIPGVAITITAEGEKAIDPKLIEAVLNVLTTAAGVK